MPGTSPGLPPDRGGPRFGLGLAALTHLSAEDTTCGHRSEHVLKILCNLLNKGAERTL